MFKIENLKMPSKCHSNGRPPVYPWESLKVGQCFRAPIKKYTSLRALCSLKKKCGLGEFTVRKLDDKTVGVWRIA